MGMKWKNRAKKILAEALAVGLLLVAAGLPPAGAGENRLPGEVMVGSEQPGQPENGNEGRDGVMPCGDLEDEIQFIA